MRISECLAVSSASSLSFLDRLKQGPPNDSVEIKLCLLAAQRFGKRWLGWLFCRRRFVIEGVTLVSARRKFDEGISCV